MEERFVHHRRHGYFDVIDVKTFLRRLYPRLTDADFEVRVRAHVCELLIILSCADT